MRTRLTSAAGWCHVAAMAALPWCGGLAAAAAPLLAVTAILSLRSWRRSPGVEPWGATMALAAGAAFLVVRAGAATMVAWAALAAVAAAVARLTSHGGRPRPDAADVLALIGWATAFAVRPDLLAEEGGGWLAPAVMLLGARRLAADATRTVEAGRRPPGPPDREARGTISLRGVTLAGGDGLPISVPIDLDLRAGDSLAVLCDHSLTVEAFADTVTGRRSPGQGEVSVDGMPLRLDQLLAARIAPGEEFVRGTVEANVGVLAGRPLDPTSSAAVREACALAEVETELGVREIEADGSPLSPLGRLLLLAARVIPSAYRVVVVVDPMPWVNPVRAEIWRSAVVRASVGRTAIWLTSDRALAKRADRVLELRHGALREIEPRRDGGRDE